MVLLHGLAGSGRTFARLLPLLGDGRSVRTQDLPGHGELADRPGADSIEEMAEFVRDTMEGPAVLVGHSMGGQVATAVAEQDPGVVRALVLINTPPTVASRLTAHQGGEAALRRARLGPLLWRITPQRATRAGMRSAVAPGSSVPEAFVEDARRLSWRTFVAATTAVDRYVAHQPLAERVAALETPVTIVFGERDLRVDVRSLDDFTGVEIVRIPQAGHSPHWEAPGIVARAIRT